MDNIIYFFRKLQEDKFNFLLFISTIVISILRDAIFV